MAPAGTLWGAPRQPLTKIILSVAALNELELEQPAWSFTNKPPEFLAKFPHGKIPTFVGTDGFELVEGTTIARYLCGLGNKVNLLGSDVKEAALVDQWAHFVEHEVGWPAKALMGIIFGFGGPFSHEALNKQLESLGRAFDHIEAHLKTRPSGYLVGDSRTLADFVLASMAYGCSHAVFGAAERAKYSAVFAHYAKVTEDDPVKQFWGTEGFTEVAVREPKTFSY